MSPGRTPLATADATSPNRTSTAGKGSPTPKKRGLSQGLLGDLRLDVEEDRPPTAGPPASPSPSFDVDSFVSGSVRSSLASLASAKAQEEGAEIQRAVASPGEGIQSGIQQREVGKHLGFHLADSPVPGGLGLGGLGEHPQDSPHTYR